MTECKGCWWEEGGRCYQGDFKRVSVKDSYAIISAVLADKRCKNFKGKRAMLSQVIPNDKLIITSEAKKGID